MVRGTQCGGDLASPLHFDHMPLPIGDGQKEQLAIHHVWRSRPSQWSPVPHSPGPRRVLDIDVHVMGDDREDNRTRSRSRTCAIAMRDRGGRSLRSTTAGLVAIFFFLDFFQQLFPGLTFDAELCERNRFQAALTDFDATLCADAIGAFGEPGQRFIDRLPPAIAHFHERNAQLAVQIHERLIADIAGRFQPPLLILSQGLAETPLDFFDEFPDALPSASDARLPGGARGASRSLAVSFGFAASGDTAILITGFSTTAAATGRALPAGLAGTFNCVTGFFFGDVFVAIALASPWMNVGRQKSSASIARLVRV